MLSATCDTSPADSAATVIRALIERIGRHAPASYQASTAPEHAVTDLLHIEQLLDGHEPESVAFQDWADVDRSFVRCMKALFGGQGYPMVATHDPRLVDIAGALATRYGRTQGSYEFQMLFGIRPDEQKRIADRGNTMRVYVPYGDEWYGYLMRRMAERPANTAFFVRALATKG